MTHALLSQYRLDPEKVLETFLALVRLDSPSGAEGPVRDYLCNWAVTLGLKPETDEKGNLWVDIPAHAQQSGDAVLMLTGHMDVVPPCIGVKPQVSGEGMERVIRSDGTTVLGADDKAGLAAMMEAVIYALEHQLPRPHVRLVFTVEEETLLTGARMLSPKALENVRFAVAFDHTGSADTVVHAAPYYAQYTLSCTGKSTHAGIMPEKGVNAIKVAAKVAAGLNLGRLDADSTANLGMIKGGKATNVVPDLAEIQGELRSHRGEVLPREKAHIEAQLAAATAAIPGSGGSLEFVTCFEGYETPREHAGVTAVGSALQAVGLTPDFCRSNGASDINVHATQYGIPGVVLGTGYVAPHTLEESVALYEMMTAAETTLEMLATFSQGGGWEQVK